MPNGIPETYLQEPITWNARGVSIPVSVSAE